VTRWLMPCLVAVIALGVSGFGPSPAAAQDDLLVLIVDPGPTRLNQARLTSAIQRSTRREIIRMTDNRAPMAQGRLTIAFSRPNRWVLRYESGGQVAWIADRVERPGELRDRLAQLSQSVVSVIDGMVEARPTPQASPSPRRSNWDDVILALQDEIVDPFAEDAPRRGRPVTVLWSEVVDPFADNGRRASVTEVWSEVLDPWAGDVRRRRR